MYRQHFGLKKSPFDLSPDADALFLSETHKEGLATLKYGILSRKGFVLLTGEAGTGKTTLINVLVKSLRSTNKVCVLSNPVLKRDEFLFFIASRFDIPFTDKAKFLLDFSEMIKKTAQNRQKILLIIDEAHILPVELLEEIRLLSNLAGSGLDVFSIFLVGQPELRDRLADQRLLPLRQRIGIRYHLDAFSLEDTVHYILFRLNRAGAASAHLFSDEAFQDIYRATRGNPRLINVLCDNALLGGYSYGKLVIDEKIVRECVKELHMAESSEGIERSSLLGGRIRRLRILVASVVSFLILLAVIAAFYHSNITHSLGRVTQKLQNIL